MEPFENGAETAIPEELYCLCFPLHLWMDGTTIILPLFIKAEDKQIF